MSSFCLVLARSSRGHALLRLRGLTDCLANLLATALMVVADPLHLIVERLALLADLDASARYSANALVDSGIAPLDAPILVVLRLKSLDYGARADSDRLRCSAREPNACVRPLALQCVSSRRLLGPLLLGALWCLVVAHLNDLVQLGLRLLSLGHLLVRQNILHDQVFVLFADGVGQFLFVVVD